MNRRASLPGADELFGLSTRQPERSPQPPGDSGDINERALTAVRRLTAAEDAHVIAARDRAAGSIDLPTPEICALLRWAVMTSSARAVVEIGAAGGVTGQWLLDAMPERGVLTSIEADAYAHELAAEAFGEIKPGARLRSILGDSATVLPRLSDAGYDLVLLQGSPASYPRDLGHARRLLRPGGILVARGVLGGGEHVDALTRFTEDLADDPGFSTVVLPLDDGIALATRLHT